MDLFTGEIKGIPCVHLATNTICIIKDSEWFNGVLNFNVLVPFFNEKTKKMEFSKATYSEVEISFT